MNSTPYNEENLPDLLPLYYRRIFPLSLIHKWLCYGNDKRFVKREISFTLFGDVYIRYLSFKTCEEFGKALFKKFPIKIDIGAIYKDSPSLKSSIHAIVPVERELVFDIDMTDYDEVRTCCSGADICIKCWKFLVIACKILDAALREDFDYKQILWVFSGRRGIHCWVADTHARMLQDSHRSAIAEYFQLIKGGLTAKRPKFSFNIPSSVQRALRIIDQYFMKHIVIAQDILGTNERLTFFLGHIDAEFRPHFADPMSEATTSEQRWNIFEITVQRLLQNQQLSRFQKHLMEEMKLFYAYPRLDINVTMAQNHLLKAPFCVHPKTGRVSVPFNPKLVDNFDPSTVPTVNQLVHEIDAYDAKNKEQEKDLMVTDDQVTVRIKDYKKTSLLKYVNSFNEFLRGLRSAVIDANASDISLMEY